MATKSVPQDSLRAVLDYSAETGQFTWFVNRGRNAKAGQIAGCVWSGYRVILTGGKLWKAHRLAWWFTHGVMPNIIDHINGDKADNRIANLRSVSVAENSQNIRKATRRSKCGLLGVWPNGLRWGASIRVSGKRHHLGTYNTPEEAHAAYVAAKRIHHPWGML